MADIIDFTKAKLEQSEQGLFYVMDPERWNPLAFITERTLFLSPKIAREVRHRKSRYEFLLTEEPPKILLYDKESKHVWVWQTDYVLNKETLEEVFGPQILGNIDRICFQIREVGYSQDTFESIEELADKLSFRQLSVLPDRNPK